MMELIREPISIESEARFRKWLRMPEANTLRKVIAARCQSIQSSALSRVLTANKGEPSELLAQSEMREASQLASFLQLIDDLCSQPNEKQFYTNKLKPTPTYAAPIESAGEED